MKTCKSFTFKSCLTIAFILFSVFGFALTPVDVPIPPDNSVPPGTIKPLSCEFVAASATISETELAVYFDFPVGMATIIVCDASNLIIYLESVDTNTTTEVFIPVGMWEGGDYTLSVSYSSTTQRGDFNIQ